MTRAADQERREHRHLTADELSAAAESVRRGGAQPEADGAGCGVCRGRVEDLLVVLDTLPRLERPALPQTVAIRLDAALVREAQRRAAEGPGPAAARRRRFGAKRGLGWAVAGLALACGTLSAAALGGVFSGSSTPATATAGSTPGPAEHPNLGLPSAVASALGQSVAASSLAAWAVSVLTGPSADAASGKEGPMTETGGAGSAEAALCAEDPAYKGLTAIAKRQGTYDGTSAELVVYGTPGQTAGTGFAVAFALPCAIGDYRILSQGSFSY